MASSFTPGTATGPGSPGFIGPVIGSPYTSNFFGGNPLQTQGNNDLTSYLGTISDPNSINQALNAANNNQFTPAGSGYDFPAGPPDASGNVIQAGGTLVTPNPLPTTDTTAGDDFMAQALAALNNGSGGPSATDLQNQANQEAALKYDPLIQQLQQNMSSAQTNEKTASGQIGDLYSSLGKALAAQMPIITNQFNNAENQSQQNYANLQGQINSNYQNAQNAQAAELQKLGIQAALPQSTKQMQSDQQYLGNQAGVNGQALNDAMRLMGQGQSDFAQRAGMIAPMQGANIQANLATQLQQLETQINQQIAGYKGQEASAAQTLLGQLTTAAQKQAQTDKQNNFNDIVKLASLEKLTHPGVFGIAPKAPTAAKYKGISGVGQYLADNSQTADPQEMETIFQSFNTSPQLAQLTGPGGAGSATIDTAWPVLQQVAMQTDPSISNDALNELYNALAIKYGKF